MKYCSNRSRYLDAQAPPTLSIICIGQSREACVYCRLGRLRKKETRSRFGLRAIYVFLRNGMHHVRVGFLREHAAVVFSSRSTERFFSLFPPPPFPPLPRLKRDPSLWLIAFSRPTPRAVTAQSLAPVRYRNEYIVKLKEVEERAPSCHLPVPRLALE